MYQVDPTTTEYKFNIPMNQQQTDDEEDDEWNTVIDSIQQQGMVWDVA